MSWEGWALVGLLVVLVIGWVLWLLANRVDRLHRKVLRSRATLEAQLAQRSVAAVELAMSGVLDPVASVLVADVAQRAVAAAPGTVVPDGFDGAGELEDAATGGPPPPAGGQADRALAESELSRTLRAVLEPHDATELAEAGEEVDALARLDAAWFRLEVARRFHNAHVAEVRRLRANPVVRLLRLAGHAPMPSSVEMDDLRPATLTVG